MGSRIVARYAQGGYRVLPLDTSVQPTWPMATLDSRPAARRRAGDA
jgi:hypothetical protein